MNEFDDIKDIESLFMMLSPVRLRRVFTWAESTGLAKLILDTEYRTEREAIEALHQHFNEPEEPKECNCPPANGTRWMVSPVYLHYSPQGEQFDYLFVIKECMAEIMAECGVVLVLTDDEQQGLINISNGPIDGRNGTLGQAYVPVSGDDMAACGRMCGDILIDEDENWTRAYFKTVFMHELLHALGIPHNSDRRSIMYAAYLGPRGLHQIDKNELLRRYPRRSFV